MAYGGNNCDDSFVQMANEVANGKIVLLTDKKGWDFIFDYEVRNNARRVTYEQVKPYAIHLNNEGHKWSL